MLYGNPMLSVMLVTSWGGISCANGSLNLIAKPRRLFDARSGGSPQVQGKLTAVNLGEKVLANPGNQQKRSRGGA